MKKKELELLNIKLKTQVFFKSISRHAIIDEIVTILDILLDEDGGYSYMGGPILAHYGELCSRIYDVGGDLGLWIKDLIKTGDNRYIEKYLEGKLNDEMKEAMEGELNTLQLLNKFSSWDVLEYLYLIYPSLIENKLPKWANTKIDVKKEFNSLIKNLGTKGYGVFAKSNMFTVEHGEISPVTNPDYQTLDELYGYDRERKLVLDNTKAFAEGKKASNVLLYGDAGTGKSSTVKAAAAEYADMGVRLIEINKSQVFQIPTIKEELVNSPLKFIFFIDDLTFTESDYNYYALKGILEGNVGSNFGNVLIYATSNRRHLIKESMEDRDGNDLHLNDTLQETMSLSSRFGLTITFAKPEKDLYLSIVEKMCLDEGILSKKTKNYKEKLEDILARAEAYAIRSNGRSPRTAKQFVVLAKNNLR